MWNGACSGGLDYLAPSSLDVVVECLASPRLQRSRALRALPLAALLDLRALGAKRAPLRPTESWMIIKTNNSRRTNQNAEFLVLMTIL